MMVNRFQSPWACTAEFQYSSTECQIKTINYDEWRNAGKTTRNVQCLRFRRFARNRVYLVVSRHV